MSITTTTTTESQLYEVLLRTLHTNELELLGQMRIPAFFYFESFVHVVIDQLLLEFIYHFFTIFFHVIYFKCAKELKIIAEI